MKVQLVSLMVFVFLLTLISGERAIGAPSTEVPKDVLEAMGLSDLIVVPGEEHPEDLPAPQTPSSKSQKAATAPDVDAQRSGESSGDAAKGTETERTEEERAEEERAEAERTEEERTEAERTEAERAARSRLAAANRKVEAVSKKVVAARLDLEQTQLVVSTSELEVRQALQVVDAANDHVRQVKQELDDVQSVAETVQLAIAQLKEKMVTLTEEGEVLVDKINLQLTLIKRLFPIQEELKKVVEESQDQEVAEALSSLGQVLVKKNGQAVQYRDGYHAINRNFETLSSKLATVENQAEGHQNTIESTRLELADANQRFVDAQNQAEEKQEALVSMQAQVEQRTAAVELTLEELRLAHLGVEQMALEMKDIESSPAVLPQSESVEDVDEAI
ncbi:MAG: hypothetical protein CMJ81_16095 [Planctomycetaceae bacterium]|nr:hypothetical protein [Planctomycetaceae bacterium]